jgi:hypothetical protein
LLDGNVQNLEIANEVPFDTVTENALLPSSRLMRSCAFPHRHQASTASAVLSAVRLFMRTTQMWISAVWQKIALFACRQNALMAADKRQNPLSTGGVFGVWQ